MKFEKLGQRSLWMSIVIVWIGIPAVFTCRQVAKASFDVASIKLNVDANIGGTGSLRSLPGGRLAARGALVNNLIRSAYGVRLDQLQGGPSWIASTRYDIDAKAEDNASAEQIRL